MSDRARMPSDLHALLASAALGTALLAATSPAGAQAFSNVKRAQVDYTAATLSPGIGCEALLKTRPRDVVEVHADAVAAQGSAPAYCRISGTLNPEIAFEVSLPAHWNGRFYMFGNGGLAGEGLDEPFRAVQRDQALANGFAVAQTNTGHYASKEPGGTFVLSNPQKKLDYAYRAVHLTVVTAKALATRYYAHRVDRAYWNSCSNGGRQGLIEAQRYPEDFDGVIANAPWVDQTGFTLGAVWNQKALEAAPLTPPKLALLAQHVLARCDALDGVKDGLIEDPRRCDFEAHRDVPACPAGTDGPDCLTGAQADTVMKIYGGPQGNGKTLFPGYMPGSEGLVAGRPGAEPASAWFGALVPVGAQGPSADFSLADNILRYLVHSPPQPDYDSRTFDFDKDPPQLAAWSRLVDAKQTDLSEFRKHGGKLLMTYGWADPILQPLAGVHYYEQAVAKNGPRTKDFFRLFMVPGMNHCSGGNGTDSFDSVSAIVDWVEKGTAPDVILAKHLQGGQSVRTRPLCPYPQVARYSGEGSIDEAASFHCVIPDKGN